MSLDRALQHAERSDDPMTLYRHELRIGRVCEPCGVPLTLSLYWIRDGLVRYDECRRLVDLLGLSADR